MPPTYDGPDPMRISRRALLTTGGVVAAGLVTAAPTTAPATASAATKVARARGVVFTTTGATFSPEIELKPSSTATVRWLDAYNHELARGIRPTIEFETAAVRTVVMVTTFSHVLTVNLGFDSTADAGDYGPGEGYNKAPEAISHVSDLGTLTQLRRFLAGGTALTGLWTSPAWRIFATSSASAHSSPRSTSRAARA